MITVNTKVAMGKLHEKYYNTFIYIWDKKLDFISYSISIKNI